jgi:hypothetical protein
VKAVKKILILEDKLLLSKINIKNNRFAPSRNAKIGKATSALEDFAWDLPKIY